MKRSPAEAACRYEAWRLNPLYAAHPQLKKGWLKITPKMFASLSRHLQHPHWQATSNAAERRARAFRHRMAPHFCLRTTASIEAALKAEAFIHKLQATQPPPPSGRCLLGKRVTTVFGAGP